MPKRTKEQMIEEIKMLAEHIEHCIGFAFERDLDLQWIGCAKRRAKDLAVECQRLEDLMDEDIEEAVQHLKKELTKDGE